MLPLREVIDFVAPALRRRYRRNCPPWPPDVFAVTATLLRRTGAYVRVVELAKPPARLLLPDDWPSTARDLGQAWRASFRVRDGLPANEAPAELAEWWGTLLSAAGREPAVPLGDVVSDDALCAAVVKLCLVADEASVGIGLDPGPDDDFQTWALLRLAVSGLASVGWEVPSSRACVLPKQHTPQRGMTLRSLSHHLALLASSEVQVAWHPPIPRVAERDLDLINLLLLPWPEEVTPENFRVVDVASVNARALPRDYRYFTFTRTGEGARAFASKVRRALRAAATCSGHIDGMVFPELSLSWNEYRTAERIARAEGMLLIAGVRIEAGNMGFRAPTNACLFLRPSGPAGRRSRPADRSPLREPPVVQRKHHRWCLDRNQILQYGLGGVLPGSRDCWEFTDIGDRRLSFITLGSWMTLTALICEDLARQDPVSSIVRTVGPNLVVALLMDGPQLKGRWSSRYASVLAEDPGSSVLALTSLGMAARSRPVPPLATRGRVIALWRDAIHGEKELELPEGCTAAVLSLSRDSLEEFSADGRGDERTSHFPVFAGFHPLRLGPD